MTNTRIRVLRLCRINYIAYTVVSDIEGATVLFDNEDVGTIIGGKLTIRIKEEEDTGTHTVAVQGGTLKQKDDEYKFSHLVKEQVPNTANASWNVTDFADITSTKTSYTKKYPDQGQVTLESRMITLNTEYDESSQVVSYTPTTFSTEVNHTLETVPVIVKLIQEESGKEMNVNLLQDAGVQYDYTVYSDIEYATVHLIDGEEVLETSTIQDGNHVFTLWHDKAKQSLNINVTGDESLLPPAEQTYLFQNNSGKINLPGIGGTFDIVDYYNIQSSYSNITYSFPDVAACDVNGSITLNKKATESDAVQKTYTPTQIVLDPTETQKDGSIEITQAESGKKLTLQYTQTAMVYYEYTVNSDVEGAQVFFDGSLEGTINGGKLVVRKYENVAKDSYSVTLQGNLPQDEITYQFEATQTSLTFNKLGETIVAPITSKKNTKSYSHSTGSVSKNKSITLNKKSTNTPVDHAYTITDGTFVSLSGINLIATPNDTYEQRSETLTFEQNDSGKTVTINVSQSAMVNVTYTVLSNCNGASVKIDGVAKGTISDGQFVYEVIENQAPESVRVEVTGGLPSNTTNYTFTVSPTSLSFSDKGETKNVTITSKSVTTTYANADTQDCSKNDSVTMNYTSSKSTNNNVGYTRSQVAGTGVSVSGTSITWSANPNKQQRTGSVQWSQSNSGKYVIVNLTQAAKVAYAYTVNSNCEGGTVYFNNVSKGTISGGTLSFEDDAENGTVRISGGVPSTSTDRQQTSTDSQRETDTDTTTENDCRVTKTLFSFGYSGGSDSAQVYSSYRNGTRTRTRTNTRPIYTVTTTTYSAPNNKTAYGDSSAVTMNYTSNSSQSTEYGSWSYGSWGSWSSWSYGSWQYETPSVSAQSNWAPGKISGSSEPWTLNVNCQSNSSTSSRSDYFNVNMANGQSQRINLSQSGKPADTYECYFYVNGQNKGMTVDENEVYASNNTSWTGFNVCNKKNGSQVSGASISKSGTNSSDLTVHPNGIHDFYSGGNLEMMYHWSTNTGNSMRGPVTVKATAANGQTFTINKIYQAYVTFNLGDTGNTSTVYDWNVTADGGGKSFWCVCQETTNVSGLTKPDWPTYSVKSGYPSWITVNKTSGLGNGDQLIITASKNTTTSARSYDIVLTENHVGKQCTIRVRQAAGQAFSVTYNETAYTSSFNLTRPWTDGLAASPQLRMNKDWTASIISKPSTSDLASISVSSSGTASSLCTIAPTSNKRFKEIQFVVQIKAKDGSGTINVTCKMRARANHFKINNRSAKSGAYYFFKSAPNQSMSSTAFLAVNLSSPGTMTIDSVAIGGTSTGLTGLFDSNNDYITTKKTVLLYKYDGSASVGAKWKQYTSLQVDAINTTNLP